jgi:hypothetical protein
MIKKIISMILVLTIGINVLSLSKGYAYTLDENGNCEPTGGTCYYPYYGTDRSISILWDAPSDKANYWFTTAHIAGNGEGKIRWYDSNNNVVGEQVLTGSTIVSFPSGEANGIKLFASTGEFHLVEAWGTNPSSPHLVFEEQPQEESSSCIGCDLFNCPGWDQYMGKLDEIKSAIPPVPNWDQVAATFRDTIVPRMVSDMETMLGTAPSVPEEPAELPDLDTRGIENKVPSMPDPGLDTSGFTKDRIESEAPEIEFHEDESGGFDIVNPMDTLPDLPDTMPIPGQTDAGEWDAGHPQETDDEPLPIPEDQDGTPEIGDAPIPNQNDDTPPSPEDDGGNPPTPNQDDGMQGAKNYKKHPDDPDGSG